MARRIKKEENKLDVVKNYKELPINDLTTSAYLRFGAYVNNYRHLPRVIDGLKISYRRLIYSALSFPQNKKIKSIMLLGKVSEIHPHSTDGLIGTVSMMVKSGIFEGQGFFGMREINGESSSAAAPRYTEVKISDTYNKILGKLIKQVPYVESPIGPMEPTYIPVPIPLCLCMDSIVSGLGVGVSTVLPNFSAKSLYKAYINNDPNLLQPNVNIVLNHNKSELSKLWTEGKGRVSYSYKTSRVTAPNGDIGILIEGDTGLFVPKLKPLEKWQEEGKVYIESWTDMSGTKLFIGKIPNIRTIGIDDIEEKVLKACTDNMTYSLNVSDGNSAFRIPLYNWIDISYKNYINLIKEDNRKQIDAVDFDIQVYSSLPLVADYIINKNPKAENEEISRVLGIDINIVSAIMSKPISNLRKNKDTSDKVKELKQKLKELIKFNPIKFTDDIINQL